MKIHKIVVGQLGVNCYIIADEATSYAMIIDPGDEAERISDLIGSEGLRPRLIVFTHAHYDHVCAARELRDLYQARLVMHADEADTYEKTKKLCISWGYEEDDFPPPDLTVNEGSKLDLGGLVFEVLHTPGHTPGGICLYGEGVLFTGDTLFRGAVGRTDLPGGDWSMLAGSLKRLSLLPGGTKVYCGHGSETSIDIESARNQFLRVI